MLAGIASAILAPLFWATAPVCAAIFTWNGGGTNSNFSTNNWTTTAPTTLDNNDFVFGALVSPFRTTANVDLGGNLNTFSFNASAASMTITGNALQFAKASANPIVNNSANLQTFITEVRQFWFTTANKTWNAASGNLSFSNVVLRGDAGGTANTTLTIDGVFDTTISGTISLAGWTSGGASLIKTNTGKLTLMNNSSVDTVTVNGGTLSLAGGTLSTTKQVSPSTTLGIRLQAGTLTVAGGNINVGTYGLGSYSGDTGALNVTAGNVSVGGALIVGWNSSPTFTVTGGAVTAASIRHQDAGAGTLTVGGTGVVTTTNVFHTTAGGGTDSLTLNLNAGGTLVANQLSMSLSGAATNTGNHSLNVNFDGGTLKAGANGTLISTNPAGTSTRAIHVTVKAGGAIIDTNGKTVDILQPLLHDSGLGATPDGGLTKTGTGRLTLTNGNTYTGGTVVQNGTLKLGAASAFPSSTALTVNSGIFDQGGFAIIVGALNGAGGVITNNGLTVTGGGNFSGEIAGAGALTNSTGELNLTGNNTYTGNTVVNSGTFRVNGTLTAGGGALTVLSGGTLGGTGTISRAVSINNGGTLSPGNGIGTLTVSNLTLQSGSFLNFELGTTNASDKVIATGTLDLGTLLGWSQFTFTTNTGFADGTYTLIDATVLSGSVDGNTNSLSGYNAYLWADTNAKDLMLTVIAIPEPSSLALVGLGLIGAVLLRRRRI